MKAIFAMRTQGLKDEKAYEQLREKRETSELPRLGPQNDRKRNKT